MSEPQNQSADAGPDRPSPRRSPRLSAFGRSVALPANRTLRLVIGLLLCLGGFLWFLPIVGFWMLPLGLAVLSADVPLVRRFSRRSGVWFRRRYPKLAARIFPKSN